MSTDKFRVPVSMLSPTVDPAQLGFEDTSELEPLTDIIGQERAIEALEFGLSFPAGQGCAFKRDMATFIESLRRDIPAAFESKKYLDGKAKLHDETEAKKKTLFQELTKLSLTRGFGFDETPAGFGLVPLNASPKWPRPWRNGVRVKNGPVDGSSRNHSEPEP